jgi:hypothetical protein
MRGPKPSYPIELTAAEAKQLEQLIRARICAFSEMETLCGRGAGSSSRRDLVAWGCTHRRVPGNTAGSVHRSLLTGSQTLQS